MKVKPYSTATNGRALSPDPLARKPRKKKVTTFQDDTEPLGQQQLRPKKKKKKRITPSDEEDQPPSVPARGPTGRKLPPIDARKKKKGRGLDRDESADSGF